MKDKIKDEVLDTYKKKFEKFNFVVSKTNEVALYIRDGITWDWVKDDRDKEVLLLAFEEQPDLCLVIEDPIDFYKSDLKDKEVGETLDIHTEFQFMILPEKLMDTKEEFLFKYVKETSGFTIQKVR